MHRSRARWQTEKEGNRIAVLIPCYNEALTIGNVVRDYRQALPDADIYVYDNNSADETARLAREAGAIVRPEPRQGKGNVVRTMFRDIEADCYLMVDGDDTYPASQAAALCARAGRTCGHGHRRPAVLHLLHGKTSAHSTTAATCWCAASTMCGARPADRTS